MTAAFDLKSYFEFNRNFINDSLDKILPSENTEPSLLNNAMRYSLFAGGKRIRPILAIAAAQTVGGIAENAKYLGIALECIHTYSLIHDDLPAMDDDALRRGKPTAHVVFGEAVAILAGDALLTFAFETLASADSQRTTRGDALLWIIKELADAAGKAKLIKGQILDITSEGLQPTQALVDEIMKCKTAALIRASLTCGARIGGANEFQVKCIGKYGDLIGAVFQIRDDLLDLEGEADVLGKAVKKDVNRGKVTYPQIFGKEKSHLMMASLVNTAVDILKPFGDNATILRHIAKYIGDRSH